MTIASRTPEGTPHRCPVCGKIAQIEASLPGGDSCCPSCGQLLWWFRDRLSERVRILPEQISLSSTLTDIGDDSLDTVELVMELEEEFGITIPDDAAQRIQTVEDAIRYIEQNRCGNSPVQGGDRQTSRGVLSGFVEDGDSKLPSSDVIQTRLRELRHSIRVRHAAEWAAAGPLRRLLLRWRIEVEFRRESKKILPSDQSLYRMRHESE